MVTIKITTERLLEAVEQLPLSELDEFIKQVMALRAKYNSPVPDEIEIALLEKINQKLPLEAQARYDELIGKRRAETLTADEYDELLRLTEYVENQQAERV